MALCEPLAVFGEKFYSLGLTAWRNADVVLHLDLLPFHEGTALIQSLNVYPNVFKEFTQRQCFPSISVPTLL